MPAQTPTPRNPGFPFGATPAELMSSLQKDGFGPVAQMGAAWAEGMNEIGTEVMSFLAQRLREDAKMQQELLACRDIADMQTIQQQFLQTTLDQYTAQTEKLVEMSQKLLNLPLPKTAA